MQSLRLRGLDGLRGIAALAVVAYHYNDIRVYYGLLGVELFFVISGFVILMTLERVGSVAEFALHRFARLYPAYWVSVAVAGCFLLLTHQTTFEVVAINATMLQGLINQTALIDPYWTLAYEVWFYIVMAALFAAGQLKRIERFALAWLMAMLVWHAAMYFGFGIPFYWSKGVLHFVMPLFGHLFIAGMMVYRIRSDGWSVARGAALALAIAQSAFGRPDWSAIPPLIYFCTNAAFIAAVWFAVFSNGWPFASSPLVWIGQRSYSIYLLFLPVQWIAFYMLGDGTIGIVVGLTFTLIAASLSWNNVERPAQAWARNVGYRQNPLA